MDDIGLYDWIETLSKANPGYSRRILGKIETEMDRFFFDWFLDLSAQWLRE